jgi:hypothetical protein
MYTTLLLLHFAQSQTDLVVNLYHLEPSLCITVCHMCAAIAHTDTVWLRIGSFELL